MREALGWIGTVALIVAIFATPFLLSFSTLGQFALVVAGIALSIGIVIWAVVSD